MDQTEPDRPTPAAGRRRANRPRPVRAHEDYAEGGSASSEPTTERPTGSMTNRRPAPKPARHWLDRR